MNAIKLVLIISIWMSGLAAITSGSTTSTYGATGAGSKAAPGVAPDNGYPSSMASTGDSITRGFNTGTVPFTDAPTNSWSTGTNAAVNSHYSRILALNPGISGHSYNDAVTGDQMVDLNSQMASVNSQHVEYVTVLLGANDACTPTEAQMTSVTTFHNQFQTALNTLATASPDARVLVLSVPNIYNLWSILHDNASARSIWSALSICQSMLVNPQSTAQADVDRRARVLQRVVDYNTQLANICATYIHCKFDNNAVFNTVFTTSDVSTRDYFHPTITGQAKIANASYAAGFDFTDATPPTSQLTRFISTSSHVLEALLTATDNVGVAGIEYKIDNGPIQRYVNIPVTVNHGSTLMYRAVDVNGNVEAWHTISAPARSKNQ